MKTFDGYKKQALTDVYALLAGGGHKPLSEFSMAHTHPYLPLNGGTVTGNIILKGGTSPDMTYAGNVHPYIRFDNSDSALNISLIFTDYDSYRRPAGIKLVGNQGNEWFEAANIYATTFYGTLSGNASTATKLTSSAGSATLPIYFSDGKPVACTASSVFSNLSSSLATNLSVTVAGQNRTIANLYARYLGSTGRPSSMNVCYGDGTLRHFLATSTTTTGKPEDDSHILHFSWDNNGGWDGQLSIPTTPTKHVQWRTMGGKDSNGNYIYNAWKTLANITDNVASATKLQTARTIWGQSFNGTSNVDNTLRIRQTTGNYCEGIRIQTGDGAWSTIILGATADSGTNTNAWSIHRKADNNFAISRNSSDGVNGLVMTSVGMGLGTTAPTHRLDVRGDTKITGSIRDLAIGGGIYWNPYVESTTDGSDAASITVVKSGVAGGTTLVLSLMNDANDTILFKTSTAARLYHNSYPILTTLNTYVSNNKGYINGTEITLVNNSDTVDGFHYYRFVYNSSFNYNRNGPYYKKIASVNTANWTWSAASLIFEVFSTGYSNSICYLGTVEVTCGHWNNTDHNPSVTCRWILKVPNSGSRIVTIKNLDTNTIDVYLANDLWDCGITFNVIYNNGFSILNVSLTDGGFVNLPTASSTIIHYIPSNPTYVGNSTSATNSDTIDGYHANGLLTALSNSNNGVSITVGGTTKSISNISVNYANSAGNANTVDGQHFNWNNNKNDHTYLWAASDNGNAYLVHRASISVNHANSADRASYLSGHGVSPNNSHPGHGARVFYSWNIGQVGNDTAGYSNGITIGSNPGDTNYGFQIVQNMWDDRTYTRRYNGGWQSWKTLAWTSDIPTVTDYYWADLKISNNSNAATNPTVALLKATKGVQIGSTADYGWYLYNNRICAGINVARDINTGSLLVSSAWADSSKVPTNGIYSKGNILTAGGFIKSGSSNSYVLLGGGGHKAESSLSVANADTVDGYHASSLWRSNGATWNPGANVSLNASGNSQEWSFDIRRNGYTGCYWQVWDSSLNTMLKVNADNGKVYAPYNFVGNLEGNASSATTATYLNVQYCRDDDLPSNKGLWNTIKNGTTNVITNRVRFYTIYGTTTALGAPTDGFGELLEICSYNTNHWQPLLWFGSGKGGRLYYRNKEYNNNTWGSWRTVAWTSEIPTVTNYYWANVKISASSSTSTSPAFSTCYTSNWFRSTGSTGWYNETYSGGWYMNDTTWIRTLNSKGVYTHTGTIYNLGHAYFACNSGYNVGIGTSAPSYKLHVTGDIYTTTGFKKNGSSNSYVLLGGGGHKAISDFSMSHSHPYLPLAGGTMTGQIRRAGQGSSWIKGRDNAMIRVNSRNGYSVLSSIKTTNGSWEIGHYDASGYNNNLLFGYYTDSDYSANNNNGRTKITFTSSGQVTAAQFNGALNGNAATASAVKDVTNGRNTYLNYATSGVTSPSWLCAWNTRSDGTYEIRAISPANMLSVIKALPLSGGTLTGDIHISHATTGNPNKGSTNPKIIFSENGAQLVALVYTDFDSYRATKGLKVTDFDGSDGTNVWFEVTGSCYVGGSTYATHFYENSDIRYKRVLRNLSINSNTIANLPLFDFEWIENNTIGTGTSALAVLLILPNIVSGTDKLTLDYGVLGTIAGITACKELVTLKSELLQLKEKVKLLEDKLRKYENI